MNVVQIIGRDQCSTDHSHGVARLNFGMHQIFSRLPFRNRLKPIQRENPNRIQLLSYFEITMPHNFNAPANYVFWSILLENVFESVRTDYSQ